MSETRATIERVCGEIDLESVTGPGTESATHRPHHRQSVRESDASYSLAALGHCAKAGDAHGVSPSLGES
jgi:hypothetical protein